jgi:putative membrane protein
MMMCGGMMGGALMGLFLGLGWIFWLALFVLIIVAIIRLWPVPIRMRDEALVVLRERYARGEIDKEEYEKRRRDLMP